MKADIEALHGHIDHLERAGGVGIDAEARVNAAALADLLAKVDQLIAQARSGDPDDHYSESINFRVNNLAASREKFAERFHVDHMEGVV